MIVFQHFLMKKTNDNRCDISKSFYTMDKNTNKCSIMKIIKIIKLHRRLRVKQEVMCHRVCLWSQDRFMRQHDESCPLLNEFSSINRAVKKVENKLPKIYFILSDLFGDSPLYIKDVKMKN